MTNLCPVCQVPIRKNAKYCTLHAAQDGMRYTVPGKPCALPGCDGRLPAGWKPRIKGSTPRKYCCEACRIKAKKLSPGFASRHREAQARYMEAVLELERRLKQKGPK